MKRLLHTLTRSFSTEGAEKTLQRTYVRAMTTKKHSAALETALKLAGFYKDHYGQGHVKYAKGLLDIAFAYKELGDFDKAVRCLKESVELFEVSAGPHHKNTISALQLLSTVYDQQGDIASATEVNRALIETIPEDDAREKSKAYFEYGQSLNKQERYRDAEAILLKSLEIIEQHYGDDNLLSLDPRLQLIKAYNRQNKVNEAHTHFKKLLKFSDSWWVDNPSQREGFRDLYAQFCKKWDIK
mmetsp:Transcript_22288/g.40367  ORF Transcript_22288/g.40367 Transcript_22288/m.40367 type:complete len:242 (+) Transcript_22288:3-728(+)